MHTTCAALARQMTATLIAHAERSWMDHKTDWRMWDQLARAYNTKLVLVDNFDAIGLSPLPLVLVDQLGVTPLEDFEHPETATYVFGRTGCPPLPETIPHAHSIRIDTPEPKSLFGVCAAAIVLRDRERKRRVDGRAHS